MVQLYIKHVDGNFYLLDLEDTEAINLKLTVKDLNDITKIFSPFTQAFNIKSTDKNKMLCGFIGNEKIARANNTGEFDSMIYIYGFLFQSGKLSFDESAYENLDQKSFKTNFANNLTALKDQLGDLTIQDLFSNEGVFEDALKIEWSPILLKDRMQSVTNLTLANGIEFKYGVPFISNSRAWRYDAANLNAVDNIAYRQLRQPDSTNQINMSEVRPAVNYMAIMNQLLKKIGTPVICPLFEKPELKELFVWCNSESLVVPEEKGNVVKNYEYTLYERVASGIIPQPVNPKYEVTKDATTGIFKIKRLATENPNRWGEGIFLTLRFEDLVSLEGPETKIKISVRNTSNQAIIASKDITGNIFTFLLKDGQLNGSGEIFLQFEVSPSTLVKWGAINIITEQFHRFLGSTYFKTTTTSLMASATLGGNRLNLITALPKIKCVDFLKSFFIMANISVISTGLNDQSMFWLTQNDIKETNKPYSKRIVDYTPYVDTAILGKKRGNQYNQYTFSHLPTSKYYDAVYGDGMQFGSLVYPAETPAKLTKFDVKTSYSIIKQSSSFQNPANVRTCLGFQRDSPTVLDNEGVRYRPVYEEFTLFYMKPKTTAGGTFAVDYSANINNEARTILEASFKNYTNGKTLAFGAVDIDTDSLYANYYSDFIQLLLNPNAYKSEFNLSLPPNEIFLNFSNLNQGGSNIPTGFRAQNEIIVGEQRYSLVDAAIDLATGKTKLTVLNF